MKTLENRVKRIVRTILTQATLNITLYVLPSSPFSLILSTGTDDASMWIANVYTPVKHQNFQLENSGTWLGRFPPPSRTPRLPPLPIRVLFHNFDFSPLFSSDLAHHELLLANSEVFRPPNEPLRRYSHIFLEQIFLQVLPWTIPSLAVSDLRNLV